MAHHAHTSKDNAAAGTQASDTVDESTDNVCLESSNISETEIDYAIEHIPDRASVELLQRAADRSHRYTLFKLCTKYVPGWTAAKLDVVAPLGGGKSGAGVNLVRVTLKGGSTLPGAAPAPAHCECGSVGPNCNSINSGSDDSDGGTNSCCCRCCTDAATATRVGAAVTKFVDGRPTYHAGATARRSKLQRRAPTRPRPPPQACCSRPCVPRHSSSSFSLPPKTTARPFPTPLAEQRRERAVAGTETPCAPRQR